MHVQSQKSLFLLFTGHLGYQPKKNSRQLRSLIMPWGHDNHRWIGTPHSHGHVKVKGSLHLRYVT